LLTGHPREEALAGCRTDSVEIGGNDAEHAGSISG
jgi:hypothetical protein